MSSQKHGVHPSGRLLSLAPRNYAAAPHPPPHFLLHTASCALFRFSSLSQALRVPAHARCMALVFLRN